MPNLVTFVDLHDEIVEIFDYLLEVIVVIYFAPIGHVPRSKLLLIFGGLHTMLLYRVCRFELSGY